MLIGCQTTCPEWSRLDGFYVVSPASENTDLRGQNINSFLTGDFFALRWSEWDMQYQPSEQAFRIELDGQPYIAELNGQKESCADFGLSISGIYTAADGDERYDFVFEADLTEAGPKWKGEALIDIDWTFTDGTEGNVQDFSVYLVATQPQ